MYWYLTHICSTHLTHIERIRAFTVAASKRSAHSKGIDQASRESFQRTLHLLELLTTHLVAVDTFAMALHSLYVLLERHNLLPKACSTQAYSSDSLRYELRMNPFIPITLPELVPYEEYQRMARLENISDAAVLERATRAIAEARKGWEAVLANGAFINDDENGTTKNKKKERAKTSVEGYWEKDVKDTMRACIGTSIGIEVMRKALKNLNNSGAAYRNGNGSGGKMNGQHEGGRGGGISNLRVNIPDVGSKKKWHDWWVVPEISELTTTVEVR